MNNNFSIMKNIIFIIYVYNVTNGLVSIGVALPVSEGSYRLWVSKRLHRM